MAASKSTKILTKQKVLAGRGDLSPFLVHLTRTGDIKLWHDIYGDVGSENFRYFTGRDNLEKIIRRSVLKAISPFGYFNYKVRAERYGVVKNPQSKVQRKWLRSVCFTETPVEHIHFQMSEISGRNLHFEPYGIAFWESSIRKKGGNLLFYFDSTNETIKESLKALAISDDCERFKNTLPLYESFGPSLYKPKREVDFRWEREWRVVGDVPFTLEDVAFGICAESDIEFFENLVQKKIPFVDPTCDINAVKEKLQKSVRGFVK